MTKTSELPINQIIVEDRQRKDLGDISELAASIKENGLIQPIVVNQANRLIAGGRRLEAVRSLGWTNVAVVYLETLTEAQLTILELEENIRRKSMTWKEEVLSVAKIHNLKSQQSALDGQEWSQKMTGYFLGMSRANVGFMITVAKELQNQSSEIQSAETFTEALRLILRRREDEAREKLAQITRSLITTSGPAQGPGQAGVSEVQTGTITIDPVPQTDRQTIDLTNTIVHGDSLKWLSAQDPEAVDHIITDPPYGIDMEMLNQQNPHGGMADISRVEAEHQVEPNLELLEAFLPLAYRILKPRGFLVLWCDVMNWQFLYDHAIACGFRVQRWPLIWHKTHQCMNQCAQFNFTKNFEIAMVCRKQASTLISPQQTSIFACPGTGYQSNPFAKPLDLWCWLINAVSIIGQTILDPFAGEGSCPMACLAVGRRPIGIELVDKHYNVMLDSVRTKCDVLFRKPIYV